jgi:hypothetical protein
MDDQVLHDIIDQDGLVNVLNSIALWLMDPGHWQSGFAIIDPSSLGGTTALCSRYAKQIRELHDSLITANNHVHAWCGSEVSDRLYRVLLGTLATEERDAPAICSP